MRKTIIFIILLAFALVGVYQMASNVFSKEISAVGAVIAIALFQNIAWEMFVWEAKTKTEEESKKIIMVLMVFVFCYFKDDRNSETLRDIAEMLDGDITADDFIKKWLEDTSPTEQFEN